MTAVGRRRLTAAAAGSSSGSGAQVAARARRRRTAGRHAVRTAGSTRASGRLGGNTGRSDAAPDEEPPPGRRETRMTGRVRLKRSAPSPARTTGAAPTPTGHAGPLSTVAAMTVRSPVCCAGSTGTSYPSDIWPPRGHCRRRCWRRRTAVTYGGRRTTC